MHAILAGVFAFFLVILPQPAASSFVQAQDEFSTSERLLGWVYGYRKKPEPNRLPEAVHAMKRLGLLRDTERSGLFVGFIAGVLSDNRRKAPRLIKAMFPMPPKEQGVIIKAIAYSELPNWKALLQKFSKRMPHRQSLIGTYMFGQAKPLMKMPLESDPTVIYTLWGYYVATGDHRPVMRIISALRWSEDKSKTSAFSWKEIKSSMWWFNQPVSIDQLTVGGTAKWTLVSYAERDRDLMTIYRYALDTQPEDIAVRLKDVIAASQSFESERIRKEELAAIDKAKRKNATALTPMSRAARAGQIAISTGCVVATAVGQVQIGAPCIIGGAVYTGAMRLLNDAQ